MTTEFAQGDWVVHAHRGVAHFIAYDDWDSETCHIVLPDDRDQPLRVSINQVMPYSMLRTALAHFIYRAADRGTIGADELPFEIADFVGLRPDVLSTDDEYALAAHARHGLVREIRTLIQDKTLTPDALAAAILTAAEMNPEAAR